MKAQQVCWLVLVGVCAGLGLGEEIVHIVDQKHWENVGEKWGWGGGAL